MKKLVKWALIGMAILVGLGTISVLVLSQKYPEGKSEGADELALSMLKSLNKEGWDSLKLLQWNFADRQQYLWNKEKDMAFIRWGEVEVLMDLSTQRGDVFVNGKIIQDSDKTEYLQKAWSHWCNDSFWMFAPFKIFDPGTSREIVKGENGQDNLLVKYNDGGVTPGDSYLWHLDENYMPTGYEMWVKIIPVGGTYATWENWEKLPCGAHVATKHNMKVYELLIKDVKEGDTFMDFGYTEDPFVLL